MNRPIPQDNGSNIKLYNDLIEEYKTAGKDTWHKLPWLFAECYLYVTPLLVQHTG
jgi:hypothetical protein